MTGSLLALEGFWLRNDYFLINKCSLFSKLSPSALCNVFYPTPYSYPVERISLFFPDTSIHNLDFELRQRHFLYISPAGEIDTSVYTPQAYPWNRMSEMPRNPLHVLTYNQDYKHFTQTSLLCKGVLRRHRRLHGCSGPKLHSKSNMSHLLRNPPPKKQQFQSCIATTTTTRE